MELKEFYDNIGEDYGLVLGRLLSDERIEKYLDLFFEKNDINDLTSQALSDRVSAVNTSHSLKGVTATLGFDHLAQTISQLHGALKESDTGKARELSGQVAETYDKICSEWKRMVRRAQ